jgi:hypothetical protein
MGADTYFPEESLGFMTITAYRLLHSTLRRRLREAGADMTPEQWGLLGAALGAGQRHTG